MVRSHIDRVHLVGAFALSMLCALQRHGEVLFSSRIMDSEHFYVRAAEALIATGSADVPWYYYSEMFAYLLTLPSEIWVGLLWLRMINAMGVALVIAAAALIVGRATSRWVGYLLIPLIIYGLDHTVMGFINGNVSGVMFLFMIIAVLFPPGPGRSVLLAFGVFPKPYSLGMVMTQGKWIYWVPAIAFTLVLMATTPSVNSLYHIEMPGNNSPTQGLHLLGIPWQVSTVAALLAAMAIGRGPRRVGRWTIPFAGELRGGERWHYGMVLGTLALPIVWNHTALILLVPIALAFEHTVALPKSQVRTLRGLVLVLVMIVYYYFTSFGIEVPAVVQAAIVEIPVLAPVVLLLRVAIVEIPAMAMIALMVLMPKEIEEASAAAPVTAPVALPNTSVAPAPSAK